MKTARIVLLFIIVTVVLLGGYFGANMYMQNMAIKKINSTIKENHWENIVEYGNVKANILSGKITIQDVKFTLQNKMASKTLGVIGLKTVVVKGDLNKNYNISGYKIDYVDLSPKLPAQLAGKTVLNADSFDFDIHKKESIIDRMKGGIYGVRISKNVVNELKNSNAKKFEAFMKIVKINNPVNIEMDYDASINKGILNINRYSIDFVNNIGISYKAKIKNVDFKGFKHATDEINKNPRNIMVLANAMSKIMQIKIIRFDLNIKNYGLVDRIIDAEAEKKNMTGQALIDKMLQQSKTIPIKSAYPAIKNFIESKSKTLSIDIKNRENLSIGDLLSRVKSKDNILNALEIKFSN